MKRNKIKRLYGLVFYLPKDKKEYESWARYFKKARARADKLINGHKNCPYGQ